MCDAIKWFSIWNENNLYTINYVCLMLIFQDNFSHFVTELRYLLSVVSSKNPTNLGTIKIYSYKLNVWVHINFQSLSWGDQFQQPICIYIKRNRNIGLTIVKGMGITVRSVQLIFVTELKDLNTLYKIWIILLDL